MIPFKALIRSTSHYEMTNSQLIQPNYSEEEVWDLLSEYLEKKHHASIHSIQRGIYADFHRDGSIFLVEECEDEFAILYCYRNINFNISGNIIYQLDSQYSEEFTLQSICEFLEKPFPKKLINIELSDEEEEEKQLNIRLATEINKTRNNIDSFNKKVRYAAISLLYAFEYTRSIPLNERIEHMTQITKDVENSSFVRVNLLQHINQVAIINPLYPTVEEVREFLEANRHLASFYEADFEDIKASAEIVYDLQYQNFFSNQARRIGSLLYPMKDWDGNIVSALNIIDLKKSNSDKDFLLIKNEANTVGTVHFNENTTSSEILFLTIDLAVADTLKSMMPAYAVHACLTTRNLLTSIKQASERHADATIIVTLNNDYADLITHKTPSQFNKGGISKVANLLSENTECFQNVGVIYPEIDLEASPIHLGLHDLFIDYGIVETETALNNELHNLIERLENGVHELSHLIEKHKNYTALINEKFDLTVPELLIAPINNSAAPETSSLPFVFATSTNSILHQESEADFIKWLNEEPTPEIKQQYEEFESKMAQFARAGQSLDPDEQSHVLSTLADKDTEQEDIF